MSKVLKTKDGIEIQGTLERMSGIAGVSFAERTADGTFELTYSGGTEVLWDETRTVCREGQRVFITENGDEVLESDLVLVDEAEDANGE